MSQQSEGRLTPPSTSEGLTCHQCGRFAAFKPCQSNQNGNKGRMIAICHGPNKEGEDCKFMRWQKGSSKSPTNSPPGSQNALPAATQTLPIPPPSTATATGCGVQKCGQSRLAPDCERKLCKKHCVAAGGCRSKNHAPSPTASAPPTSTQAPPPSAPDAPPPPPTMPPSTATQALTNPPASAPPATVPAVANVIDAQPNPRYISHMPPIFTEQWRQEQELAEQKRAEDARRLASASQAKHGVVLYAWLEDGATPLIHEFQSGFTWPFFALTADILAAVDLNDGASGGNARSHVQLYRPALGVWAGFSEGYTLELREGDRIFLKASHVVEPLDFDKHLHAGSKDSILHLRKNLAQERRDVNKRIHSNGGETDIDDLSSDDSAKKTKNSKTNKRPQGRRRLSPLPSSFATKKQRRSNRTPSPPPLSQPRHHRLPSKSKAVAPHVSKLAPVKLPPREVIVISSDSELEEFPLQVLAPVPNVHSVKAEEDVKQPMPACDSSSGEDTIEETKRWPADYRVQDILAFFADVHDHPKEKIDRIFSQHFPDTAYRSSTYYDNLKRWKSAKQSVRDKCADRRWSTFLRLSRLQ